MILSFMIWAGGGFWAAQRGFDNQDNTYELFGLTMIVGAILELMIYGGLYYVFG